jgi:hypothetical protein
MSLTGNAIDIQKIQLTDTFQTWFTKTNEIVDALNPVNIYDIDDGAGTNVTYGLTGTAYNGVKYVNVNAGYGVGVGGGSAKPWTGVVGLDLSGISGDSYTLTGNPDYTLTGSSNIRTSEVNASDYFLVQDISDTAQGASGTTKRVQARYMLPREVYQPTLDFYGDLNVKGKFYASAANSTTLGSLSINSQYVYLATTGNASSTAGAYSADNLLNEGGVVIAMTGGIPNKEFLWKFNTDSTKSYWTFNTPFGAKEPNLPLVVSKFISRNFVSGTTANTFIFEAAGSTSTRLWLTENGVAPYFGIVKDAGSSNVNLNVYNGAGITSVAYIIAGATSQYTGVTANAFIQYANVDLHDGAHATTGASAWTIPVSDQFGQLYAERHNAGQVKRRFVQAGHGLTTGQAVALVVTGAGIAGVAGTLTGAQANSIYSEALGIVDRVISTSEVSVTMKGYMDLSSNGLLGIGTPVTGQVYYLDWAVKGGLTTSTNVPQSYLYQPVFVALGASSGIVYGAEANVIFPYAQDQVYMRGMIPIGSIQPYAGGFAGLSLGLSGGSIPVSDVQYNGNWQPCDGRALSATGASGFVDLFNLIGYTYSMRGTVISSQGASDTVIQPDRGTSNLGTLNIPAGNIRAIRRSAGTVNSQFTVAHTGITADGTTITVKGVPAQTGNLGTVGNIVDILSPLDGSYFFTPDLRGKAPFGEYGPYGARGEGFSLTAGATGGTATGDGGLFTNYIIRAKREADALILTGHNHDTRYLRRDTDSNVVAGSTLTLQNVEIAGVLGNAGNIGIGTQPLSWAAGYTGRALTVQRNGNFGTFVTVYNTDQTSTRALAGLALNNNVANGYVALYGNNSVSHANMTSLENDISGGGLLLYSGSQNGPIQFKLGGGIERMRIDPQGTVKFPQGLTYSSLIGSTPAKPTETTGLLNYDRTSGVMTLGSWSSGADALMTFITTSGGTAAERMRIDPAGNVGIGTSNPIRKLHIVSASDTPSAIVDDGTISQVFAYPSQGGSVAYSGTLSNHAHALITNNAQRLWITNAGDIGIGTSNPNSLFNLYGNSPVLNIENADPAGNAGGVLQFGHNQSSDRKPIAEIRAVLTDGSPVNRAGNLAFYTSFSGTLSPRMIVLADGKVGIGTSTPSNILAIQGGTADTPTNLDKTKGIVLEGGMGSPSYSSIGYSSGGGGGAGIHFSRGTGYQTNISFTTNSASTPGALTERMKIDSAGNVGIGTGSPQTAFQVISTAIEHGAVNRGNLNIGTGIANGNRQLQLGVSETNNTAWIDGWLNSTGVLNLSIQPSGGNVGIGTTTPTRKLHISSPTNIPSAIVDDGTITQVFAYPSQQGGVAYSGTLSNHAHALLTNNLSRLWITSSGNVGIGTISPQVALDVNGEVRSSTSTTGGSNAKTLTTKDYVDTINRIIGVASSSTVVTAGSANNNPGGVGTAGADQHYGTSGVTLFASLGSNTFTKINNSSNLLIQFPPINFTLSATASPFIRFIVRVTLTRNGADIPYDIPIYTNTTGTALSSTPFTLNDVLITSSTLNTGTTTWSIGTAGTQSIYNTSTNAGAPGSAGTNTNGSSGSYILKSISVFAFQNIIAVGPQSITFTYSGSLGTTRSIIISEIN